MARDLYRFGMALWCAVIVWGAGAGVARADVQSDVFELKVAVDQLRREVAVLRASLAESNLEIGRLKAELAARDAAGAEAGAVADGAGAADAEMPAEEAGGDDWLMLEVLEAKSPDVGAYRAELAQANGTISRLGKEAKAAKDRYDKMERENARPSYYGYKEKPHTQVSLGEARGLMNTLERQYRTAQGAALRAQRKIDEAQDLVLVSCRSVDGNRVLTVHATGPFKHVAQTMEAGQKYRMRVGRIGPSTYRMLAAEHADE